MHAVKHRGNTVVSIDVTQRPLNKYNIINNGKQGPFNLVIPFCLWCKFLSNYCWFIYRRRSAQVISLSLWDCLNEVTCTHSEPGIYSGSSIDNKPLLFKPLKPVISELSDFLNFNNLVLKQCSSTLWKHLQANLGFGEYQYPYHFSW